MTIANIKDKILPTLRKNDVKFAGIFGSYSRKEAKKNSDVDILVKFSAQKSLLDFIGLENELSEKLNKKVDLVTEESLSPYIKKYALNDLKVIYEKR